MTNIKSYIVGGYIRDKLLGIPSKDIDIAIEADSYSSMRDFLIKKGVEIFLEKPEYFTIRGRHKELGAVDFVLCRKDGFYSDHRRPDTVELGTIYDDLSRRDFTINAIALEESTENYIDPFNGQKDLKNRLITAVGNADERFNEDPLRILRAIRFKIKYKFLFDQSVEYAICRNKDLIYTLSEDRVRDELGKCFRVDTQQTIFELNKYLLTNIVFDKTKFNLWLKPTSEQP